MAKTMTEKIKTAELLKNHEVRIRRLEELLKGMRVMETSPVGIAS